MEKLDNAGSLGSGNTTESRLCAIWSDLLGIPDVGPEDDFLDLGGDSFLAIRMLGQIRTEFDRSLEAPDFFENPTVRALAQRLDGAETDREFHRLVPVRYDLDQPPTHTFEGTFVFAFATSQIIERLQLRFPVYSVTIDWTFGNLDYSEGIHELAKAHVEELIEFDPHGPYRLAGFSLGGFIAHEMARLLHEDGRQVEFLVLLDPLLPRFERQMAASPQTEDSGPPHGGSEPAVGSSAGSSWQRFLKTPVLKKPAWIWRRRSGFRRYALRSGARVLRTLYRKGMWPSPKVPLALRSEWALLCKELIWDVYEPQPYAGDMILFAGEGRIEAGREFWSSLVHGHLDCRSVPVDDHDDVLLQPESLGPITACFDELLNASRPEHEARTSGLKN